MQIIKMQNRRSYLPARIVTINISSEKRTLAKITIIIIKKTITDTNPDMTISHLPI